GRVCFECGEEVGDLGVVRLAAECATPAGDGARGEVRLRWNTEDRSRAVLGNIPVTGVGQVGATGGSAVRDTADLGRGAATKLAIVEQRPDDEDRILHRGRHAPRREL